MFCGNVPYSLFYGVRVEETQLFYILRNLQYGTWYKIKGRHESVVRESYHVFTRSYEDTGESIIDCISNLQDELFYI